MRRAFSLIELLVVLAIIGLLVALLLPSLQKARESGRRVVCMANLRQMTLGCFNYATDARGWTPWSPRGNGFPPTHVQFGVRNIFHNANKALGAFPDEQGPEVVGKAIELDYLPATPRYLYCPSRTPPDRYAPGTTSFGWSNWLNHSTTEYSYMHRLQRRLEDHTIKPNNVFGSEVAISDGSAVGTLFFGAPMSHQDGYYNTIFYDASARPVIDTARIIEATSGSYFNQPGKALTKIDELSRQ